MPLRKIIHIDMDAFYASVEQRDTPAYRGKPLAVGGSKERGVVAAASYEARKFGIHSAMPSSRAYKLCPAIIFVKPRFEVYRQVSSQIHQVFRQHTDLVEPLSLDEAYLDVTHDKQQIRSATLIAQTIKQEIKEATGLTASAGVSFNKFLAKIASDYDKPDGLKVILPHEADLFLEQLPINKFHGIGKVTTEKMHQLGVFSGYDLKQQSEVFLQKHFGKAGLFYYKIVRGDDTREVKPNRIRKSIGTERTFHFDLDQPAQLAVKIEELTEELVIRLQQHETIGNTLTLKIKYADFSLVTKRITMHEPVSTETDILPLAFHLLDMAATEHKSIRLLGLTLSSLTSGKLIAGRQLTFNFKDSLR